MSEKKVFKLEGTITNIKGKCSAGHEEGDKFELSGHSSGGLCGFFYHDLFPSILTLQYGGTFPWQSEPNKITVECPDRYNLVTMDIKRIEK